MGNLCGNNDYDVTLTIMKQNKQVEITKQIKKTEIQRQKVCHPPFCKLPSFLVDGMILSYTGVDEVVI